MPRNIVRIANADVYTTMDAASVLSPSICWAIVKLDTAVGAPNRSKIGTKNSSRKPREIPKNSPEEYTKKGQNNVNR